MSYLSGILLLMFFCCVSDVSTSFAETSESAISDELNFEGTDSKTTEHFTVEHGWEVTWKTKSKSFKLSAYGVTAQQYTGSITEPEQIVRSFEVYQPIILANSSDSSGNAFHPLGGTFYLKIIADGPWTIKLKAIKRTKDYLDVPYTGAP